MTTSSQFDSVDELLEQFLSTLPTESTRRAYLSDLNEFLTWCTEQSIDPLTVSPAELRRYRYFLTAERNLSPSTIDRRRVGLRSFFEFLTKNGFISDNPMLDPAWSPRSTFGRQMETLPLAATRALVQAAEHENLQDLLIVELVSIYGLMVSEIAALTVGSVDLKSDAIRVGSPIRKIPLAPETVTALSNHISTQSHGPLFHTQYGTPLNKSAIANTIKRVARRANVSPPPSARVLRSTAISLALAQGPRYSELKETMKVSRLERFTSHADIHGRDIKTTLLSVARLLHNNPNQSRPTWQEVCSLLDDETFHPSIAVGSAGALLEWTLRSRCIQDGISVPDDVSRGSIEVYTQILRKEGVLDNSQHKEVTSLAHYRNEAAHGKFESIDRSGARQALFRIERILAQLLAS